MGFANSLKDRVVRRLAPHLLRSLRNAPEPFHRMLWAGVQLQRNTISPERFRSALDEFYSTFDVSALGEYVRLDEILQVLRSVSGYKVRVDHFDQQPARARHRYSIWDNRFRLLAKLGIHSDILILRGEETIPPHGHIGVVSGFLVLEGQVRVQHFHRLSQEESGMALQPTIDKVLSGGQYTTNSEYCDDVHWLQGIAGESFLFRTNVVGVESTRWQGIRKLTDRLYVNPTGRADAAGLVFAPFIDEREARKLRMGEQASVSDTSSK